MLKLIFKSLWSRRRWNGWLFAELIVVSIVTWVIADPVIVLLHDRNIPQGYDADRLCLVTLASLLPEASGYQTEEEDSANIVNNYLRLVEKVRQYADIEDAAPLIGFCFPNSSGSSNAAYRVDSTEVAIMNMEFLPDTHLFEVYGFSSAEGSLPVSQLSGRDYVGQDLILTENAVKALFGTSDARGKSCYTIEYNDTVEHRIRGVLKSIKMSSAWRPLPVAFRPMLSVNVDDVLQYGYILLRLKPNVSKEHFLHDFRLWMNKELWAGNLYARSVKSYDTLMAESEYLEGVTNTFRMNIAMAIFFLINLVLGVAGSFWMQTRSRREEVGVMRSFGATPRQIRRLLLGEGVVLTTFATIIGCFLYLQYALSEGLYTGASWMENVDEGYWVSGFASHFCMVSLFVYILLLMVVLLGVSIPVRALSKVSPTEALRDE